MTRLFLVPILLTLLPLITLGQKASKKNKLKPPPNGVEIGDNLYIDKTEISNINWLEYSFYEFGSNGSINAPDTSVWSKVNNCLKPLEDQYLRFPQSRNFPTVGLSQNQARDYSKWREKVIFFSMLKANKKIKPPSYAPTRMEMENFTVESYFNGTYPYIAEKAEKATHFWKFSLPTEEEYMQALQYNDSLLTAFRINCKSRKCRECLQNPPPIVSLPNPCEKGVSPTQSVLGEGCLPPNSIHNLKGNVAEWLDEDNLSIGGGWIDTIEAIQTSILLRETKPNAYTGFRNVARWTKWGE